MRNKKLYKMPLWVIVCILLTTYNAYSQCGTPPDIEATYCPGQNAEIVVDDPASNTRYLWYTSETDDIPSNGEDGKGREFIPPGNQTGTADFYYVKETDLTVGPNFTAPAGGESVVNDGVNSYHIPINAAADFHLKTVTVVAKLEDPTSTYGFAVRYHDGVDSTYSEWLTGQPSDFLSLGSGYYSIELPVDLVIPQGAGNIEFISDDDPDGAYVAAEEFYWWDVDEYNGDSYGVDGDVELLDPDVDVDGTDLTPMIMDWDITVVCPRTTVSTTESTVCCTPVGENFSVTAEISTPKKTDFPVDLTVSGPDINSNMFYYWYNSKNEVVADGKGLMTYEALEGGQYSVRVVNEDGYQNEFACYKKKAVNLGLQRIKAPGDTTICLGDPLSLKGEGAEGDYNWFSDDPETDSYIVEKDVQETDVYILKPGEFKFTVEGDVKLGDIVPDGKFEEFDKDNPLFNTAYGLNEAETGIGGNNEYRVGNQTIGWGQNWCPVETYPDFYTKVDPVTKDVVTRGDFMYADAYQEDSPEAPPYTADFAKKYPLYHLNQMPVEKNTTYTFTMDIANWKPNNEDPPVMMLVINGEPLDFYVEGTKVTSDAEPYFSFPEDSAGCQWMTVTATWESGDTANADIVVSEVANQVSGHEFAMDDVSFFTGRGKQTDDVVVTVDNCFEMEARADGSTCIGDPFPLSMVKNNGFFMDWTNSDGDIIATAEDSKSYPLKNETYTARVKFPLKNFLKNGSFEQDLLSLDFTTDLSKPQNATVADGEYFVGTGASSYRHSEMLDQGDHTTGDGSGKVMMMFFEQNDIIVEKTFSAVANEDYAFAVWLNHIANNNKADYEFEFLVNGIVEEIFLLPAGADWTKFSHIWKANTSGDVTIQLRAISNPQNTALALDDISLTELGYETTDDVVVTVNNCFELEARVDTTVCIGDPLPLYTVKNNGYVSGWEDSDGNIIATTEKARILPLKSGNYTVKAKFPVVNYWENGDFETGSVNFATGFSFATNQNTNKGQYFVGTGSEPVMQNNSTPFEKTITDHTSGAGYMMFAQVGDATATTLLSKTVTLEAGEDYAFSAWVKNAHPHVYDGSFGSSDEVIFELLINGALEYTYTLTENPDWNNFDYKWSEATGGNVDIELRVSSGNYNSSFVIDDIALNKLGYEDSDEVFVTVDTCNTLSITDEECEGTVRRLTYETDAVFTGWYDSDDNLLSMADTLKIEPEDLEKYYAKAGIAIGDINTNGDMETRDLTGMALPPANGDKTGKNFLGNNEYAFVENSGEFDNFNDQASPDGSGNYLIVNTAVGTDQLLYQSNPIVVTSGKTYELSFNLAHVATQTTIDGYTALHPIEVFVGGTSIGEVELPADNSWQEFSIPYVPSSTGNVNIKLVLTNMENGSQDFAHGIDNVKFSETADILIDSIEVEPCFDCTPPTDLVVEGAGKDTLTFCEGTAITLGATYTDIAIIEYNYTWYKGADKVDSLGTTYANLDITGAVADSGWYYLAVEDSTTGIPKCVAYDSVFVNIDGKIDPGVILEDQTICNGDVPDPFTSDSPATRGDFTSYTYGWEKSIDKGVTWAAIVGADELTYTETESLTDTVMYRRTVSSGVCADTATDSITVFVRPVLDAGELAAVDTICFNGTPDVIESTATGAPAGGSGSANYTYEWLQSDSETGTYTAVSPASNTVDYQAPALKETTWFKRVVIDANCSSDTTEAIEVFVRDSLQAGAISDFQDICYNSVPADLTETTAAEGGSKPYTYEWESSLTGAAGSWNPIASSNTKDFTFSDALTDSTYFRRVVTSANSCGSAISDSVLVGVYGELEGGKIEADTSICEGADPNALRSLIDPSGGVDLTYTWQSSTDNDSYSDLSGTGLTYDPAELNDTTWFRRMTTSGNSCGDVYSDTVQIITIPNETPNVTVDADTINTCANAPVTINVDTKVSEGVNPKFTWEIDGAADNTFDDLETFSKSFATNGEFKVRVIMESDITCVTKRTDTATTVVNVTEVVVPTVSIAPTPEDTVCENTEVTLTATADGVSTSAEYVWYNGTTELQNSTSNEYTQTFAITDTIRVVVKANSSCAIPDTAFADIAINVVEPPVQPNIVENDTVKICVDDTELNVTDGNGVWSLKDQTLTAPTLSSTTDNPVTVQGMPVNTSVTVYYTNSVADNICPAKRDSVVVQRTGELSQPVASTDVDSLCQDNGSTTIVNLSGSNFDNATEEISWQALDGDVLSSSSNPNTTVTGLTIAGAHRFVYEISSRFGTCSATDTVVVQIDSLPQNVDITDPASYKQICSDEITLTAADPSIGEITWSADGIGSIVAGTPATTATLTLSPVAPATGGMSKARFEVNNGQCMVFDTVTVEKVGDGVAPNIDLDTSGTFVSVNGKTIDLCLENEYKLRGNGYELYSSTQSGSWKLISGSSVAEPSSSASETAAGVSFTPTATGTSELHYIVETSACPNDTAKVVFNVFDVPVDPDPITPATAADTMVCENTSASYSVPAVAGADTYTWSVNNAAVSIATGQGTQDVTLDFGDTPATAPYDVELTLTAGNDCGDSDTTITIKVMPDLEPTVTIDGSISICADSTGSFEVTAITNAVDADYEWFIRRGGSETTTGVADSVTTLSNLQNGDNIIVKMTSDYMCPAPATVESNSVEVEVVEMVPVAVEITSDLDAPVCEGTEVTFTASPVDNSGGSAPTYRWWLNGTLKSETSDEIELTLTNASNNIEVELTSNISCYDNETANTDVDFAVTPNATLAVDPLTAKDTCKGLTVAPFEATGSGFGNNPTYKWTLNGDEVGSDASYIPSATLNVGDYDVILIVESSIECVDKRTDTVETTYSVNALPEAKITTPSELFCPSSYTTLTASPAGGTYKWTMNTSSTVLGTNSTYDASVEATYKVEVTDANGCVNTASQLMSEFAGNITIHEGDTTKCKEDEVTLTVPESFNIYTWYHNDVEQTGVDFDGQVINVTDPGEYKVVGTIDTGNNTTCEAADSVIVTDVARPAPAINEPSAIVCETNPYVLTAQDTLGNPGSLVWYEVDTDEAIETTNSFYPVTSSGSYYVTIDNGYCTGESDTVDVTVDVMPKAVITPGEAWVPEGEPVNLSGLYSEFAYHHEWQSAQSGDDLEVSLIGDQAIAYPDSMLNLYTLTVYSANKAPGCVDSDTARVHVEFPVKPWNSFSPNGDGMYDTWIIESLETYPDCKVEVYNRWGTLVWKSDGYNEPWKGENFRNGAQLPVATYYYVIYPNGGSINDPLTGPVTIVK